MNRRELIHTECKTEYSPTKALTDMLDDSRLSWVSDTCPAEKMFSAPWNFRENR